MFQGISMEWEFFQHFFPSSTVRVLQWAKIPEKEGIWWENRHRFGTGAAPGVCSFLVIHGPGKLFPWAAFPGGFAGIFGFGNAVIPRGFGI